MAKRRHATPKYLPTAQKAAWEKRYDDALAQAKINHPEDEAGQHTAAHKEANKMLAVPAPKSAKEIDALKDWQITKRETRDIDGVAHRIVATIDGKKYAHPVKAEEPAPPAETK